VTAPLYDVAAALGELRRYRDTAADPVARASVELADELARVMRQQFPDPSDAAIAGHAVVILAGSLAGVPPDMPPDMVFAVAALAGQRLAEGVPS
jgi:hypothetical protein